jgi:hypothetical protein
MAVLSEARAKAMPLNQFMAQFLKLPARSAKRAKEALAEFKKKPK